MGIMNETTNPYVYFEQLATAVAEPTPDSIISRSILKNEATDVTLFAFAAGQELTEHTASRPAILHFLQGEAEIGLGADTKRAGAGTWVYMEPRLPHSIKAETAVTMLLILLK
jgi:quercetin dioxygenase-like cupin family protein